MIINKIYKFDSSCSEYKDVKYDGIECNLINVTRENPDYRLHVWAEGHTYDPTVIIKKQIHMYNFLKKYHKFIENIDFLFNCGFPDIEEMTRDALDYILLSEA